MNRSIALVLLLLASSIPLPLWAAVDAETGAEADDSLNCVILPDEQVELSSPIPGVIEQVLVRRSDRVVRDQVLARLESSVENATLALAAAREETDAEIRLRRVELGYDAQQRDRLQQLHARQAVSAQSREEAERTANVARLRLRLAKDRRREARLERRRADAVLALKTLRSPIDGVIVERLKTVGEYVEDQPVVRIARLDPLRVEVIAPLALFGTVRAGMQVAIRPETDPEHERTATVNAVDAMADPGSGTFGVQLALPNPGLELPAGTKCKARMLLRVAAAENPEPAALPVTPPPAEPGGCLSYETPAAGRDARLLARVAAHLAAQSEGCRSAQASVLPATPVPESDDGPLVATLAPSAASVGCLRYEAPAAVGETRILARVAAHLTARTERCTSSRQAAAPATAFNASGDPEMPW